jgi:hypothetical protein
MANSTFAMIAPLLGRRVGGIRSYPFTRDVGPTGSVRTPVSNITQHVSHIGANPPAVSLNTRPVHAGLTTEPLGRSRTFDDQVKSGSVDYRIRPTLPRWVRSLR